MAGETTLEVTEVTEAITLSLTEVDETVVLTIQEAPQGPMGPAGTTDYNELENVPTTFPPSAHTHNSDEITEGDNLFYTDSRVANWLLTGVAFVTATAITAADGLLSALGKLQAQISAEIGARGQADANLQTAITAEASTRSTNDSNLSTSIGLKADKASPIFTGAVAMPQLTITFSPTASTSAVRANGTLYTGGTGTTTLPYQLFQPTAATAVTTWNTSGTWMGINAASGFAGNFLDFRVNGGVSVFRVASSGDLVVSSTTVSSTSGTGCGVFVGGVGIGGALNVAGSIVSSAAIVAGAGNGFYWSGRCVMTSPSNGVVNFYYNNGTTPATINAGSLTLTADLAVSGIPSGPTAAVGTNTTQFSTTAFVQAALSNLISNAVTWLAKITAPAVIVDAVELTASNLVSVTSTRALASTDNGKVLDITGTGQVDLTANNALPTGFRCRIKNRLTGGGRLSLVTSSTTINGATATLRVDRNSELELEWISSNAYSLTRRNLSHRADWTDERRVVLVDDFFSLNDWWNGVSGTGAIQPWVYNTGDSGVIRLKTGTTLGGIATTAKGAHATVSLVALKPWRYVAIVSLESIAADFKARVGFANLNNNYVNDIWSNGAGMGFDFTAASSANWRFYSGAGGAFTYTDTGVAAVAGVWVKLEIRSSGTDNQVYFSINGGAETLVTGAVDYLSGPAFGIISTAANDRGLLVDYVCLEGYKAR